MGDGQVAAPETRGSRRVSGSTLSDRGVARRREAGMGRRAEVLPASRQGRFERLRRSDLLYDLAKLIAVGAIYYVAARLSLRLALVHKNVTPLWAPAGIAVVAFLVLGRRIWPGIALAAFLVNAPISTNPLAAAATAGGNTIAPLVAAELLHRVHFRLEMDRLRDAASIVFVAALASMLLSASIGAGTLVLSGAIAERQFFTAWGVWWTGDAMGVLVVAPFLLSLLL